MQREWITSSYILFLVFLTARAQYCTTDDCKDIIITVIGPTGVGKSSFCNLISGVREGDAETYPVCAGIDSCTYQTTAKRVKWMGTGEEFMLLDTPGLGDSQGRDSQHIDEMTDELKHLQYVNAFIIMFNAAQPRLDENLQSQLKIFVKIFGPKFFDNVLMVFNRWGYHKYAEDTRRRTGESKERFIEEFNKKFRNLFGVTRHIDAFFIDTYPDPDDETMMKAIKFELSKIKQEVMKMPRFLCEDIEAVRGFLDDLHSKIKEEKERSDMMKKDLDNKEEQLQTTQQRLMKEEKSRLMVEQNLKLTEKDLQNEKRITEVKEQERNKVEEEQRKKDRENKNNWEYGKYFTGAGAILVLRLAGRAIGLPIP